MFGISTAMVFTVIMRLVRTTYVDLKDGERTQALGALFARQDYVEEAWRSVDPVLRADTRIFEYEKGAWGPSEVEQRISAPEAGIIRSHQIRKISG